MNNKLRFLHIYPTMNCPLNCAYCYVDEVNMQKEELSLSDYFEMIKQAKSLGLELVDIAGGEPLTFLDIYPLIKMISKENIPIRLVSNGLFLDHFQANVKSMYNIDLHVSLDSPDEEIQDAVRSFKGLYKKVRENITCIQEQFGPCVTVNIVINRTNYRSMYEMLSYLTDLGIQRVDFQPVMSVSKKTSSNLFELSVEELLETYQTIQEFSLQHSYIINISIAIPAYLYPIIQKRNIFQETNSINYTFVYGRLTGEPYTNSLYIKSNGDAYLSAAMINNETWKVGNIKNKSVEMIWNQDSNVVRRYVDTLKRTYSHNIMCNKCCAKRYCSMADIAYFMPYITNNTCSIMDNINKL